SLLNDWSPKYRPAPAATSPAPMRTTDVVAFAVQNGLCAWVSGAGGSAAGCTSVSTGAGAGEAAATGAGGASGVKLTWATCPATASTSDVLAPPAANFASSTWCPGITSRGSGSGA